MGDDLCVAQVQEWADGLAELSALIGRRFARSEPREHAMAYVRGLLTAEERKNSWTLSEQAGDAPPLRTTRWLRGLRTVKAGFEVSSRTSSGSVATCHALGKRQALCKGPRHGSQQFSVSPCVSVYWKVESGQ